MMIESDRLDTFVNWPSGASVRPTDLARAGFYYMGTGDWVKCAFCGLIVRNWGQGESPIQRHRTQNPSCPFFLGLDDRNIPQEVPRGTATPRGVSESQSHAVGGNMTGLATFGGASPGGFQDVNAANFPNPINTRCTAIDSDGNGSFLTPEALALTRSLDYILSDVTTVKIELQLRNRTVAHAENIAARPINENISVPPLHTEVHTQMRIESDRLDTFINVNWPCGASVRPRDLARAGFYYMGTEDWVKCAFCGLIVRNWEQGESPIQRHRTQNPSCPLVRGLDVRNIPQEVPRGTSTPCGVSESQDQAVGGNVTGLANATAGHNQYGPRHENYYNADARAQSFANWSPYRIPCPEALASAGFFYNGIGDNVTCFFCDGRLSHWEPQQDPWFEHALNYPRCGFVRQYKGDAFIQWVKERNSRNNPPPQTQAKAQNPHGAPGSCHEGARDTKSLLDTPVAQEVLDMGFSQDTVLQVIEQRMQNTGDDFPSTQSLVDAILNIEHGTGVKRAADTASTEVPVSPQEEPDQNSQNPGMSEAPGAMETEKQSTKKPKKKEETEL